MRKLIFALAMGTAGFAQPTAPPPIVQIVSWPGFGYQTRNYASAGKAAVDVVGLAAATGMPQSWTIELHENFASIEDLDRAIGGTQSGPNDSRGQTPEDLLTPPRTLIAAYQADWSYRPDEATRLLPKARWMRISILRVRPGLEADFQELVHLRKLTNESVNLDRPELAYHVISGAPSGMYLVVSPLPSLRALDEGVADVPGFAAPVADARAKAAPKAADLLVGSENLLFRVDPRLSSVSDDFAAAGDSSFWRATVGQ